jgi:hypothetical protein
MYRFCRLLASISQLSSNRLLIGYEALYNPTVSVVGWSATAAHRPIAIEGVHGGACGATFPITPTATD